jgi:hypothetical protein
VVKLLQTRGVHFMDLSSKELINDLKEAVTCEVSNVCALPCHRCPYIREKIDIEKIKIEGLNSYTIKLEKIEEQQLLIYITATGIDNWLTKNNLPFILPENNDEVGKVDNSKQA